MEQKIIEQIYKTVKVLKKQKLINVAKIFLYRKRKEWELIFSITNAIDYYLTLCKRD